jgi:hypothetical protein
VTHEVIGIHSYVVCDYCGHIHTVPFESWPSQCRAKSCRQPLHGGTRTTFDTLDDAKRYSQAVLDYNRE